MRDWAINYVLHVLEAKDWSANRLANETGLATFTINRPLREKDWPHKLSRTTINKIQTASGIDPAPFIPAGLAEDSGSYLNGPVATVARRALESLDTSPAAPSALQVNEIKVAVVGPLAQIVATIDRSGVAKLRQKLDAIEAMLDD